VGSGASVDAGEEKVSFLCKKLNSVVLLPVA
jgi:hypothetical protein